MDEGWLVSEELDPKSFMPLINSACGQAISREMRITQPVNVHGKLMKSLFLWAIVVVSLSGCSRDHHDHPNLTTGEQLFNYHCAECHGEKGTGKLFDGIPANILTQKSPQGIIKYITTGTEHERDMPVFKTMPADEAKVITDHLLKLKKTYEDKNGPQIRQLLIEP